MTPSPWAVAGAAAVVIGVQLQTRWVEEPYLRALHGVDFLRWAAQAGRFLPRVGRITPNA